MLSQQKIDDHNRERGDGPYINFEFDNHVHGVPASDAPQVDGDLYLGAIVPTDKVVDNYHERYSFDDREIREGK